jgi:tRNA pseudouridine55 synthase
MIGDSLDGVINFFKPKGMTSHDAVQFFRKLTGIRKIGHTGTLDPMATGVLPICIGTATRIAEYITGADKEYIAGMSLGIRTDTLDSTGKVLEFSDEIVTDNDILKALEEFRGQIIQIPPMFSAKKTGGKKLYELARNGLDVERKPHKVEIYQLELLSIRNNKDIMFRAGCSKGTYIRTICDDLGTTLGTFGHMTYLLRTKAGSFDLPHSVGVNSLKEMNREELKNVIVPIEAALKDLPFVAVREDRYEKMLNGLTTRLDDGYNLYELDKPVRAYAGKRFVGIGSIRCVDNSRILKMEKVLAK